ncbi:hypothetical protein Tco_0529818 [Tanacetum coccineum]
MKPLNMKLPRADMDHEKPGFELGESKMESNGSFRVVCTLEQALEAKEKEVRCHDPGVAELWSLQGLYGGSRVVERNGGRAACKLLMESSRDNYHREHYYHGEQYYHGDVLLWRAYYHRREQDYWDDTTKEILKDLEMLPKELLKMIWKSTQRDIEEILGDTTQRDTSMYLGNNISG